MTMGAWGAGLARASNSVMRAGGVRFPDRHAPGARHVAGREVRAAPGVQEGDLELVGLPGRGRGDIADHLLRRWGELGVGFRRGCGRLGALRDDGGLGRRRCGGRRGQGRLRNGDRGLGWCRRRGRGSRQRRLGCPSGPVQLPVRPGPAVGQTGAYQGGGQEGRGFQEIRGELGHRGGSHGSGDASLARFRCPITITS